MTAEAGAAGPLVRFASDTDVDAVAELHATRIADSFLTTLGTPFLRRLYRRVIRSAGAFVLVADDAGRAERVPVCGFVAVAEHTGALYREFLLHDGALAAATAAAGIARRPKAVWETARYGLRGGSEAEDAEVLSTAVAETYGGRGIGGRLVRAATEELRRRGVGSARVVTAVGNLAAMKAYEHGGFRAAELVEVHSGIAQQQLVWP
jgi:ribosomal protein S18 acetylase RimI-like enzyme